MSAFSTAAIPMAAAPRSTRSRGYWQGVARRLSRDPVTLACGAILLLMALAILRAHVLPNVLGPIFVYATSLISVSMILASGLSFLGLGTRPPEPEWWLMLNTLRTAIYSQPLLAILPGLCIFVTSICFNLLSDGLRSAMDVRA